MTSPLPELLSKTEIRPSALLARELLADLHSAGFTHATGVPCSLLSALFAEVDSPASPLAYIPAVREDTALGVASGLTVAGKLPLVMMQNSGLGYCLNVITSFNLIYEVNLALVVSWRGFEGKDAVEHDVIGRTLTDLLDVLDIPWVVLDSERSGDSVRAFLDNFDHGRRTSVLIVKDGLSA